MSKITREFVQLSGEDGSRDPCHAVVEEAVKEKIKTCIVRVYDMEMDCCIFFFQSMDQAILKAGQKLQYLRKNNYIWPKSDISDEQRRTKLEESTSSSQPSKK